MVKEFLFILIVSFFGVYSHADLLDEGQASMIAESAEWKKLLHFQGDGSQINSAEFFLNPEGRNKSFSELRDNIVRFKNDSKYACRFPARAKYLAENLKLEYKKCSEVEEWKELINPQSVALVYVTQYVSNPVSIFGHSFLLFQNKTRPLNLDVVFNNAAQVPENVSTYDYVVKGMFGGFPTIYTKEPFYIKIQEYNNIENRDQWIYELNLSKEEIDQLLNHLWELSNLKNEEYFFLNVNCAFNIYNALAAVRNDIDFVSENKLYVLPVETLKKVDKIKTQVTYHPSIREKIVQRYKQLNDSDSRDIDEAEISLELYEFRKSQNGGQLSASDLEAYNSQLLARSKLGRRKSPFLYESPVYPAGAHPTWNLSLGFEHQGEQTVTSLAASPFHHSLLQSQVGFLPHSEIVVLEILLEKKENEPTYFEQLTFIKMSNFAEVSNFDSQYSWRFDTKLKRQEGTHFFPGAFVDVGKSKKFFEDYLFYALVGLNIEQSQILHPEIRLGMLSNLPFVNIKLEMHTLQNSEQKELRKSIFEVAGNFKLKEEIDIDLKAVSSKEKPVYSVNINYNF